MTDPKAFITRWSRRKLAASEDARADSAGANPPPSRDERSAGVGAPLVGAQNNSGRPQGPPLRSPLPTPPPQGGREQTELSAYRQDASDAAVDLTKLPPIESITAATDIRPFLARGVPSELTRAALRRAWAADPSIRDFIGLAENAWDFNASDAMGGFGPLELTDELRREISAMVGRGLWNEREVSVNEQQPRSSTDPHQTALPSLRETKPVDPGSSPGQALSLSQDGVTESGAPLVTADAGLSQSEHKGARQRDVTSPDCVPQVAQRRHGGALPQ